MRKITRRGSVEVKEKKPISRRKAHAERIKLARSVDKGVRRNRKKIEQDSPVEFLSSGSTTMNLALSGKGKDGGWARARVLNIVGDGSSGKTICALELAFWCYQNVKNIVSKIFPKVTKVTIVYNNCEGVMDFPLVKMYGQDFVDAVEWICIKKVEASGRDYIRRMKALKKGEFLLYIIDSWDAIGSAAGEKRMDDSVAQDKELEGSYQLEKQKYASLFFEYLSGKMANNAYDATLFIISQVRTKIGITFGKKTYRAGGKALDFYTHQVAWIAEREKLKKTKLKQTRVYGIKSTVKVERSKVAKPFREAEFTILYDYGIDNISSMADFLWGKKQIKFNGNTFTQRPSFIKYIERSKRHEDRLISETERTWKDIEQAFEDEVRERKRRF